MTEDWMTVKQAATALEISPQRVYALLAGGSLSGTKLGFTRLVSRRSVNLYKESPTRNKYAGGNLRPVGDDGQPGLFDPGQRVMTYDGEEYNGLRPPVLSDEARRLYDASPLGARDARLAGERNRGEV